MNTEPRGFRLAPIAHAIAWALATGTVMGQAHAAPAFSPAWFATMGANQNSARTTGMVNGKPASSFTSPAGQQQQASAQLQQSINNLGLAAQGIAAQQAAQAAARQAAMSAGSSVPDGLGTGGLDSTSLVSSWINAKAPIQSSDANGKTVVDVQQTADKAIANWNTFNVGKNTIVQFDQQPDWAILNRVTDPSARPSQILGQIKGAGTVMLVNRNGIIFSGSSQVNVRNLVAAAAEITDDQFKTNGIYSVQASGAYVPSFTDATGALVVDSGAQINTSASTSATQGGGYVLLLGAEVKNAGSVTTPGGQAELAAGDFFIVRPGQGTTTNQYSTTHGNEISPQFNAGSTAGNVTNSGLLMATQGDITLAGHTVVQDGVAVATTSVNTRGTIHLLTSASDATSSVTTTANGLNAIVLDDSGGTALDSQRDAMINASAQQDVNRRAAVLGVFDNLSQQDDRVDESRVEIVSGGNVNFDTGSTTLATGGQIAVASGKTIGRTTVSNGATLDVSGAVGVIVSMESNNVLVNVQGNEQRDAPVDRDTTNLNSSNVWIDKRDLIFVPAGTGGDTSDRWYTEGGLLEVSGYLGLAGHSIGEWAAQGGSVVFGGNEVVTQTGSKINLSGGSLNVQTGMMKMTWLTGADGQLYNADDAPGDIAYTGIYKGFEDAHPRWGADASEFFYNPLIGPQQRLENGYTTGRDAGRMIVATNSAVLEGDVDAATYQGPQQTQKENTALDGYNQSQNAAAQGAQLILGNYTSAQNIDPANGPVGYFNNLAPTFDTVVFGDEADISGALANGGALPADRVGTAYINGDRLNGIGFGSIITAANDNVTINDALVVTPGGSIDLYAPQVNINANLTARGGNIALGDVFRAYNTGSGSSSSAFDFGLPTPAGTRAQVDVGQGITLDARGTWTNLQMDAEDRTGLPYIDGGVVSIRSTGGVLLDTGSIIDVSSGATLMLNGTLKGGKGGDVTLAAGTTADQSVAPPGALLQLLGTIKAYGVNGGGTLHIESGTAIDIDGNPLQANGILEAGQAAAVGSRLAQDYTVGAGEPLPVDFSVTETAYAPGFTFTIETDSARAPFVTAADWSVPAGVIVTILHVGGVIGPAVIPHGTTIVEIDHIPVGFTVPGNVFPDGIPHAAVITNYTAGTILSTPLVIPTGTPIGVGDVFARTVSVESFQPLDSKIFQSGFSQYVVNGHDGVSVADGAAVNVFMPVYQMNANAPGMATGADPSQALQLWTPPLYQEDPVNGQLIQRGGASLSLVAGTALDSATVFAPLSVGAGATINVDPGSAISLHGNGGQVTIDGRLNAWGGSIVISSLPGNVLMDQSSTTRSIWIGEDAMLDVAGRAVVAQDNQGRAYGIAPDGGSITLGLSDAFLVIRPGALLDASGSSATVDLSAGSAASAPSRPQTLAGDGGSIALNSYVGMVLDGDMRAAAGAAGSTGAAGGSLTINMDNRPYNSSLEAIPDAFQILHSVTLVQNRQAGSLAADLKPGQADAALVVGDAVIGANQIQAGGFDALTLAAHDLLVFDGDIDLSLGRSINLQHGVLTMADATPDARVNLNAPYIRLDGGSWSGTSNFYSPGLTTVNSAMRTSGDSALTLSADLIDIYGALYNGANGIQGDGFINGGVLAQPHTVDVPGFKTLALNSQGDIRLGNTALLSPGDIMIDAAQIYPMSGASAQIMAGLQLTPTFGRKLIDPDSLLQIRSNGAVAPVPDSVFGELTLAGGTVDQGGVVQAPLGVIAINDTGGLSTLTVGPALTLTTILRSGSLTSVSANGLVIPFGGTVDGLTYRGADGAGGSDTTLYNLGATVINRPQGNNAVASDVLPQGITLGGISIIGEAGAVLDLSGGGDLRGAGFISGRGGSVDILTTSLANANPALNTYSKSGNQVYAIVPGRASDYAPVIADKGYGDPAIGRQIEIGANVPGLPAGTYTLLPASYALMPGAWRVEVGSQIKAAGPSTVAVPGGSWVTFGTLKTANTSIRDALPTQLILSPGDTVRDTSQYNEMTYADFAISQAARFGNVRPRLAEDGKILRLNFTQNDNAQPLQFDGTAKMNGVDGGIDGTLIVNGDKPLEITGDGAAPVAGSISLAANQLNAFGAGAVMIGGWLNYFDGLSNSGDGVRLYFESAGNQGNAVHVRDGADLKAGQIFLINQNVTVDGGAILDTRGFDSAGVDSNMGLVYANSLRAGQTGVPAVLAVANGWLDFLPAEGSGTISVADGASLLTEGTLAFVAPGGLNLGNADLGARYLTVSQNQVNIGDPAAMAAAQAADQLPAGWQLTQDVLDRLLHPSSDAGVPALERLSLTAGGAFNFFGSVTLDTGDSKAQLVFNTPAFYGWGSGSDVVHIATDTLVWNGLSSGTGLGADPDTSTPADPYVSVKPTPIVAGGPGSGASTLVIDANTVLFGYDAMSRPQTQTTLDRVAVGFGAVDINATDSITANSKGTLSVGQSQDSSGHLQGGSLTMNTPLLTGAAGSVMNYISSGAIEVAMPAGTTAADTSAITTLGASITLQGPRVTLDTPVALPSGKLTITTDGDINLGDNANIDMAGRGITFFDLTKYSWGGDVVLESTNGSILQSAGSSIDLSAAHNNAGLLSLKSVNGTTTLDGTLLAQGGIADGYLGGRFALQTRSLDDGAFGSLNQQLNGAGFFGARDFTIEQGSLTVGGGVQAHEVSIAIDGGSLTVNGLIDASGMMPGTIRLAARDALTLASTAVLDAHGTVLQVDSDGVAIDAKNKATIELSASTGMLTLAAGSTMNESTADGIARGEINLDVARTGETSGDINIDATGPVNISGAQSIAVNAFWTYSPTDANGSIVQNNGDTAPVATGGADEGFVGLDQIDVNSKLFIDAAGHNLNLQNRLAGVAAYGAAFHLRPGVEIDSSAQSGGKLTVAGDLDLSGYRYGPNADPAVRGSGEPGVLVLRAAGDLNVNGSITDGFAVPGATPDDITGWGVQLPTGVLSSPYQVNVAGVVLLDQQSSIPLNSTINVDFTIADDPSFFGSSSILFIPGVVLPSDAKVFDVFFPNSTVATAPVIDALGNVVYHAGDTIPAGTDVPNGVLGAGFNVGTANITLNSIKVPANTNFSTLFTAPFFGTDIFLLIDTPVPMGAILPQGSVLAYAGSDFIPTRAVGADGTQGKMYANAPMLDPGLQSWSMRLVGGADLASADSRALQSAQSLAAAGNVGNVLLFDPHSAGVDAAARVPALSVLRTGTGDLDILAGGNYIQNSLFGVYTAGTAIDTADSADYNAGRADLPDSNLGATYLPTLNAQRMWFAEHGGDVSLTAQGDITGFQNVNSLSIGDWLWRQGGDGVSQKTAWGINFGSYVTDGDGSTFALGQAGFAGIGSLGGGNVTVNAGGNIGVAGNLQLSPIFAVAGSGRVVDDGDGPRVVQTGGGNLSVTAGGAISGGLMVNLRGETTVDAAQVGVVPLGHYGTLFNDPRPLDPNIAYAARVDDGQGVAFGVGDGVVTVNTLGDLALGNLVDPGRVGLRVETAGTTVDDTQSGATASWFTLWRNDTAINAFSAGGNVIAAGDQSLGQITTRYLPPILRVVSAGGAIYMAPGQASLMMPSPDGQLELLASGLITADSGNIAGNSSEPISLLGTSQASMATPLHAAWSIMDSTGVQVLASNYWADAASPIDFFGPYDYTYNVGGAGYVGIGGNLIMYGPNTITDNSMAGQGIQSHIYSVNGDVLDMQFGAIPTFNGGQLTYYNTSKPVRMMAGGDIVNSNVMIAQDSPLDVSMVAAQGSIINTNVTIAGPGTLEVSAGKQIYQSNKANLVSLGAIVPGDTRQGADIAVQAGLGAGTPGEGASDFRDFANLYLDPANLADPSRPLASQPGKVAKNYDGELIAWLGQRYGFTGDLTQAMAAFDALAPEQQRIFARQVYYAELTAGGREFNDPDSPRFNSYLRGRDAIAALFPKLDADGNAIQRSGDLTMFQGTTTNGGVRTLAGGNIQTLTPGGQTIVGVEGVTPSNISPAGLITQGSGDIQMYSNGSILLGLSRVMTTFGGDILGWSAEGDINAGRGSKTTVVFTPPKREYDEFGNVKLSPDVPSTGAGIATLAPIPEVPAGDVDLIAPLGTIDAGEAGIRVSGNVNLAALQVVNAANIEVKGNATGIPMVALVNVAALTNASAAATQATVAAQDVVQRERTAARQALPSIFTVRVLGFGNDQVEDNDKAPPPPPITQSSVAPRYDPSHLVQLVGLGGNFDSQQLTRLTDDERRRLQRGR